ncbi:MAG: ATP-binding cassette domain-containing protein, partial [Christensenellaceae bacterium]
VSQDATLFQASILDNIRWGRPGADMRQVEEAARRAKIHDFIGTLPEGYATILSDGAQNISGGQRQRIALARAILKDAPILLLDEFTSALDEDTERTMIDDLRPVFQGKTVLMIAHRPAALAVADRIVSLEKGRLSPVSPKRS